MAWARGGRHCRDLQLQVGSLEAQLEDVSAELAAALEASGGSSSGSAPSFGQRVSNPTSGNWIFWFQEGENNNTFRLEISNQIGGTNYYMQAYIENTPYGELQGLSNNFDYSFGDNGDGTFNHLLTSTAPVQAWGSVVFTANQPVPAGDGDRSKISLYLSETP